MTKIAFIGAGKMAEAVIARLKSPQNIIASDLNKKRLSFLKKKYGIRVAKNNLEAFVAGDLVILAIKPQDMAGVLGEFGVRSSEFGEDKLVVSIAAGIPLAYLQNKLRGLSVVRAMPNNPCLVGMGMTALAKGKSVKSKLFSKAVSIFAAVGLVVVVPEEWMDAVTGLSGSGPAYIYSAVEALTDGGIAVGLKKNVAAMLALQTVLGAAITVKGTDKTPSELRKMVASPGGTTLEGLKILSKYRFNKALVEAVKAATKKSKLLSKKWTK